ncbi:MAG: ABC transporter ATP-binding protein [Saprospiraceae bacterium]|nr:ABC transporter ATP-binding protein [Saprospiraceae bacterium]
MKEQQEVVISLKNVNKTFRIRDRGGNLQERVKNLLRPSKVQEIQALRDINVDIYKGEFFGIVGHNGSGKSTLLRIMSGTYPPDRGGEAYIEGRYMRLTLGLGFDKELTAHENIYLNGSILGLSMKEIGRRYHDIIDFAELKGYEQTKVKFFSTGMLSRLKFAIAVQADADVFLMDEFFGGVGDIRFMERSEQVFKEAILKGRTIVHVSHSLKTMEAHCDRVMALDKGKILAIGEPSEVISLYRKHLKNQRGRQVGGVKMNT